MHRSLWMLWEHDISRIDARALRHSGSQERTIGGVRRILENRRNYAKIYDINWSDTILHMQNLLLWYLILGYCTLLGNCIHVVWSITMPLRSTLVQNLTNRDHHRFRAKLAFYPGSGSMLFLVRLALWRRQVSRIHRLRAHRKHCQKLADVRAYMQHIITTLKEDALHITLITLMCCLYPDPRIPS